MRALLCLALLALAACASEPPPASAMRDGPPADPPPGWTNYCLANPKDPSC